MNRSFFAAIVCVALLASAANSFAYGSFENGDGWITGSGISRTEDRHVPSFTAIEVEGSGNVILSQGPVQSVVVTADENVLPVVKTEVVGNVLHIGFQPDTHVHSATRLEFRISVPEVTGIAISGSGDVQATGPLHSPALLLDISGSGSIDAALDAGDVQASIGGSGDIAVKGRADRIVATINGSGSLRARDLASSSANLRINGSGDAAVNATDIIAITLSGSGNVQYGGGAKATIRSSGSGTIQQY